MASLSNYISKSNSILDVKLLNDKSSFLDDDGRTADYDFQADNFQKFSGTEMFLGKPMNSSKNARDFLNQRLGEPISPQYRSKFEGTAESSKMGGTMNGVNLYDGAFNFDNNRNHTTENTEQLDQSQCQSILYSKMKSFEKIISRDPKESSKRSESGQREESKEEPREMSRANVDHKANLLKIVINASSAKSSQKLDERPKSLMSP